jgi:hypothetical protein
MDLVFPADRREFLRISQAVGMGFLIMGVIGYIVKLSTLSPYPSGHSCSAISWELRADREWKKGEEKEERRKERK